MAIRREITQTRLRAGALQRAGVSREGRVEP